MRVIILLMVFNGFKLNSQSLLLDYQNQNPLQIIIDWDLRNVQSNEYVFTLTDDSTFIEYEVELLKDKNGLPEAYTTYIKTPVCDDNFCNLMHIQIYWNVLGNYIGFDTIPGNPLTKNDHIEFKIEDYNKLHKLLMNDNSIIKRKDKKDLFDDDEERVSDIVDAVTGATAQEVKDAVVEGALYSSYTIYHITYGVLSDSIFNDMKQRYSDSLEYKLLFSKHPDYQMFALKQLKESDFYIKKERILELIGESIPINRMYIMKKMPIKMWSESIVQITISDYYPDLDINGQTYFLQKIEDAENIEAKCIYNLTKSLDTMSQNQLKSYIRILSKEQIALTSELIQQIDSMLKNGNQHYGYLLEEFLNNDPVTQN